MITCVQKCLLDYLIKTINKISTELVILLNEFRLLLMIYVLFKAKNAALNCVFCMDTILII